ncbi:hypothetical protein, partial [Escherichia coli]|uniref:hypothetical protein n=1 Tax=Escherichia coli TaxID=562 RepID=UPI001ADD6C80
WGIVLFPDSTNPHQYGTIINSGTIVARTAIQAIEGYLTGIHVFNSGRIEGILSIDQNLNIITNQTGAVWVGDFQLGMHEDVVL